MTKNVKMFFLMGRCEIPWRGVHTASPDHHSNPRKCFFNQCFSSVAIVRILSVRCLLEGTRSTVASCFVSSHPVCFFFYCFCFVFVLFCLGGGVAFFLTYCLFWFFVPLICAVLFTMQERNQKDSVRVVCFVCVCLVFVCLFVCFWGG